MCTSVTSTHRCTTATGTPRGCCPSPLRCAPAKGSIRVVYQSQDRKSTRLNSSHVEISYAVFCLKKKNKVESLQNYKRPTLIVNRSVSTEQPITATIKLQFYFLFISARAMASHSVGGSAEKKTKR